MKTPRKRDPQRTRESILKAAREEFCQNGLDGARVDRIARLARTNKRMLYHYFGNKEDLYLTVLERAYAEIREKERELTLADTEPLEGMRRLVRFSWRFFLEHPHFIRLLNTENLHQACFVRRSTVIRDMHTPLVAMLEDLLRRGAEVGHFRANVDPVQLYITIAGIGYFYCSNVYTLSTIFARDLLSEEALQIRERHVEEVVLGYLRPPACHTVDAVEADVDERNI